MRPCTAAFVRHFATQYLSFLAVQTSMLQQAAQLMLCWPECMLLTFAEKADAVMSRELWLSQGADRKHFAWPLPLLPAPLPALPPSLG